MKKYLIDLYLPSVGKHYDVYLPAGKKIGEATELLISIAESLSRGGYRGNENSVLINAKNSEPLDRNFTVHDAGIRNSEMLILI